MCDECPTSSLFHLKLTDFLLCRFPLQFSGKNQRQAMKGRGKVQGTILFKRTEKTKEN